MYIFNKPVCKTLIFCRKLTPILQQHGGDHDQLGTEYEKLLTDDIIVSQLEQAFDNSNFVAKGFLSDLFMVNTWIYMSQPNLHTYS